MSIELDRIRVFDVLRNGLNDELALVMSVSGDRLDLRDKAGAIARYKFGKHFSRVSDDEAIDFRAVVHAARKQLQSGKKKPRRSVSAFLNRLKKR